MSYQAHRKPVELLRGMAARHGERITQRDASTLLLAAEMLETQAAELEKHFKVYATVLSDLITHQTRADAMTASLRALLETHS